jgi:hypothetical protein
MYAFSNFLLIYIGVSHISPGRVCGSSLRSTSFQMSIAGDVIDKCWAVKERAISEMEKGARI